MALIFLLKNYFFKDILTSLRHKFNTRYKPCSLELTITEDRMLMSELNVWCMDTFIQYLKYRNWRSPLGISYFAAVSMKTKEKSEQEIHDLHITGNFLSLRKVNLGESREILQFQPMLWRLCSYSHISQSGFHIESYQDMQHWHNFQLNLKSKFEI